MKECQLYHEFIKYQQSAEKYVKFKCVKIPVDTCDIIAAVAKTSITSWLEHLKNVHMHTIYELFKAWLRIYYPKIWRKYGVDYRVDSEYYDIIMDAKKKNIKLSSKIYKKTLY